MKNLLIDSHELVWILYEPDRINSRVSKELAEADMIYVSIASLWELALKHYKGKLAYKPDELLAGVEALGARLLQIGPEHIIHLKRIQTPHKDPFDRMLLAQARVDNLLLVTADNELNDSDSGYTIDARR